MLTIKSLRSTAAALAVAGCFDISMPWSALTELRAQDSETRSLSSPFSESIAVENAPYLENAESVEGVVITPSQPDEFTYERPATGEEFVHFFKGTGKSGFSLRPGIPIRSMSSVTMTEKLFL